MVEVVSPRFEHCLFQFTMPLAEVSSETGFFTHFSESVTSKIHRLVGSPFFGKDLKFNLDLKNEKKNKTKSVVSEIIASEFAQFLLKREYFSRALNPLTNSFKTLHISKRHFFQPNCLNNDQ